MRFSLLLLPALMWLSCAGPARTTDPAASTPRALENVITVEGRVSVRGHEPFSAVLLETDQRNFYVLALEEAARQAFQRDLPARYRITGVLYGADWDGMRYAHLRPLKMERQ